MSKEKQIEKMAIVLTEGRCFDCRSCLDRDRFNCKAINDARLLYNAGYRKQSDLYPCDACRFNPPSSGDGKPCTVCPAQAKGGAE